MAAVRFRQWLRPLVARWAAGDPAAPSDEQVAHLNNMLAAASANAELARADGTSCSPVAGPGHPQALLAPSRRGGSRPARPRRPVACAQLLGTDCTLWSYDRTKAHQRRWCSMAICGNRAKARVHRARLAGHAPSGT
jgi:predicted RNA-binding Zn ribbon-like protein